MRKLVYILLSALAAASCRFTVLENRTSCPSLLYFQVFNAGAFENVDRVHVSTYRFPDEESLGCDTTTIRALEGRSFCVNIVSADAVQGSGVLGFRHCRLDGEGRWTVPPGQDFDSLFRFSYLSYVEPECFTVPVEFVKEHCRITLQFVDADLPEGTRFPFDVVLRSNTIGLNALTGEPVTGTFECLADELSPGIFQCILPRQADDNLLLELYGRPGLHAEEGLAHSFNLGAILRDSGGISWKEKNLPDVLVGIDFNELDIQVQVTPWDYENIEYAY